MMNVRFILVILQILMVYDVSGQVFQKRSARSKWQTATATWYGEVDGDGSDGGACGYGPMVSHRPLKTRVSAVSPILFGNGMGCGACYKVKCKDPGICSRRAVTVIVTDLCPGGNFEKNGYHFDLSGAAFGRLSVAGEESVLRNRGLIDIIFRRTPCTYGSTNISFKIVEGSTSFWLSLLVLFEDGDGDLSSLEIKEEGSEEWIHMNHVWGANWCLNARPLSGALSLRLTSSFTKSILIAKNVIPSNWVTQATYVARGLNFIP